MPETKITGSDLYKKTQYEVLLFIVNTWIYTELFSVKVDSTLALGLLHKAIIPLLL